MIFSRRRGAGRHAKPDEARSTTLTAAERRREQRAALLEELGIDTESTYSPGGANGVSGGPAARSGTPELVRTGPYDFAEAPPADRVDLGSLLLPAIDGVEIRLQASEDGVIQQIVLAHGDNALQLGVFAAPRTDGMWDEVRAEIRKSLFDDGVAAEDVSGNWGTELRARLRTQNGFDDLRFIGIDGPRWMVRAVFQGPAAVDPILGGPLNDCLNGLVVRRDDTARPTREGLPLRLPEEMTQPQTGAPAVEAVPELPPALEQVPRRKPSPRPRRD